MIPLPKVIRPFAYEHNAEQASRQDYELAKVGYRAACDGFDARDERSRGRFHAAIDRRRNAYERWMFHKFGN